MSTKTLGGVAVFAAAMTMILACLLASIGCEGVVVTCEPQTEECSEPECPSVPAELVRFAELCYGPEDANLLDLPPQWRTKNYGGGSCMHAAIEDVLKWHGFFELAAWWRENYSGGFSVPGAARVMDDLGLAFAFTDDGDEAFLEWCSRNRHGAAIHYYPNHAITFRGYSQGYAILQDNNRTDERIRVEKAEFIRNWKGYGGYAITVVYDPLSPTPY